MVFNSRKVIQTIKKGEAVKALAKRAKDAVRRRVFKEEIEVGNDAPALLNTFTEPIKNDMNAVNLKVSAGESVVKPSLSSLSEQQLKDIKAIFVKVEGSCVNEVERLVKTGNVEERLVQAFYIISPEINKVDNGISALQELRLKLTYSFLDAFAQDYSIPKGVEHVFNIGNFVQDLNDELSYRRGVRRGTERSENNVSSEAVAEESGGCCLM